jgi:hypothetical protein
MKRKKVRKETKEFTAAVGRALRRAAKAARKTARMHGTPIYIWKTAKSSRRNHKNRSKFDVRSSSLRSLGVRGPNLKLTLLSL